MIYRKFAYKIFKNRHYLYLLLISLCIFKIIRFLFNSSSDSDLGSLHTLCQTTIASQSDIYLQLAPNPDGVGHVALNIIYGMVYSYYRGWRFIGYRSDNNPHNIDTERFLDFIFSQPECYSDSHVLNKVAFKSKVRIDSVGTMERMALPVKGTVIETTFLDLRDASADRSSVDHIFTDVVLHDLLVLSSKGVQNELTRFSYFRQCAISRTTVAAHLRWGDFAPGERRSIRDWLFVVLIQIQHLVSDSCIHVFTSVLTHDEEHILMNEMVHFTDAGISVHIHVEAANTATEELISNVAHFIDADVLVMSPSSLSVLAGVLSKGCIVYPKVMKLYPALGHWMQVPMRQFGNLVFTLETMAEELAEMNKALPQCVKNLH